MSKPSPGTSASHGDIAVGARKPLPPLARSLPGALPGLALLCLAIGLLAWNERRAAPAPQGLGRAVHDVAEVAAAAVDPAQDGRLVHLSGVIDTAAPLSDPQMGVSERGLVHLERKVEMYQWKESRQASPGSQANGLEPRATFSYAKKWSEDPIDSSRFRVPLRHANPPMPIRSHRVTAQDATIGRRVLAPVLLDGLDDLKPVAPPPLAPAGYVRTADGFYQGSRAGAPEIGDVRISFSGVPVQTVSVMAEQQGKRLAPFETASGYRLGIVAPGPLSAAAMANQLGSKDELSTWLLRVAGFAMLATALMAIATPLGAAVPAFGAMLPAGRKAVALGLALPVTLGTIGLARIAYRPLLGAALLASAALLVLGFGWLWRIRRLHAVPTSPIAAA